MSPVDGVPGRILQAVIDGRPVLDEFNVDRLDLLASHETQRGIAGCSDEVEPALVHQGYHLVRRGGGLDVDLAACFLFEAGHPVIVLVRLAALDVAGPCDDIDLTLSRANFLLHLLGCGQPRDRGKRGERDDRCLHEGHSSVLPVEPKFRAARLAAACGPCHVL